MAVASLAIGGASAILGLLLGFLKAYLTSLAGCGDDGPSTHAAASVVDAHWS